MQQCHLCTTPCEPDLSTSNYQLNSSKFCPSRKTTSILGVIFQGAHKSTKTEGSYKSWFLQSPLSSEPECGFLMFILYYTRRNSNYDTVLSVLYHTMPNNDTRMLLSTWSLGPSLFHCGLALQRGEMPRQAGGSQCQALGIRATAFLCWYMAFSVKGGVRFVAVLRKTASLFGVYIGAPDFWKLPHRPGGSKKPEVGPVCIASTCGGKLRSLP